MKAKYANVVIRNKLVATGLVVAVLVAAGSASYAVASRWGGSGAEAEDTQIPPGPTPRDTWPPYPPGEGPGRGPASVDPPGPDVTPLPGAAPDLTQPWWYVPYLNAERGKVPFSGTVNGIVITTASVTLDPAEFQSTCSTIRRTPATHADADVRGALPSYLPLGTIRSDAEFDVAFWCDGSLLSVGSQFEVASDDSKGMRGGTFTVYRYRGEPVAGATAPSERWSASTISGYQAAVAAPILPEIGLGTSYVVVYDGEFVTRVMASNLPLVEVVKITEGLFSR